MEYIKVTKENLETEHICCAISNNKDIQVCSPKSWLADRFEEGLVFLKSAERAIPFRAVHIQNKEDARNAPTPIKTYALFFNGNYLTNEQMNEKRFLKLVEQNIT